ncbi:hypothetical protein [Cohnella sp. AR92]|uniref:hypothetical protein n=1 Tax=Cohnella sp. AR92 TaxID=648716 RepID=UPI000F8EDBE9|nr:hypothetical protein [Cohnella sp. AR92]RUS47345.1 hypothetical protein ELR57_09460 [Cohnella sp. AR92]
MPKWIVLLLAGILLLSGCKDSNVQKETAVQEETAAPSVTAVSQSTPEPSESPNPVPTVPDSFRKYYDFVDGEHLGNLIFHAKEDLDGDGTDEIILAFGWISEEDPLDSWVSDLVFLRETDGQLTKLGDNWAAQAYGIYKVELIRLQGSNKKYLWCGLTNGGWLKGVQIIEFQNSEPRELFYIASATGSGEETLTDDNQDGYYDGLISDRSSYDVLYYETQRYYRWTGKEFVYVSTHTDVGEYPGSVKETILQYLALRVLNIEYSPEIDARLAELCTDTEADQAETAPDVWTSSLLESILEIGDTIDFQIKEAADAANAIVTLKSVESDEHIVFTFDLLHSDGKWVIDRLEQLE